jgi:hypothetical protein
MGAERREEVEKLEKALGKKLQIDVPMGFDILLIYQRHSSGRRGDGKNGA